MEDDISQLLINSHKKAQRAATEEQMVESGAMGAWNGTRLETDTMSNPAQQQDFDLECDLQLDDLDDNKILT